MKILALATCYNRKDKTIASVRKLIAGNPSLDFEFIIADDASTDGTAEALSNFPNVKVMHGDGNSYYTGGMKIAMAEALSRLGGENAKEGGCAPAPDYVMLFNDDVGFYDGAVEGVLKKKEDFFEKAKPVKDEASEAGKEDLILVGPTCEADGVTLSYGGVKRKSNFRPKFWKVRAGDNLGKIGRTEETGSRQADTLLEVDTFNANCVLIPTELFLKTGNMDKKYRHSLGDFDYGYMLRKKGGRIYVSDEYVGVCPFNSEEGTWNDTSLKRSERFRKKESVKGVPFGEFFHYLLKNYNLLTAIIYSFSPYVRILIGK